MNDRARQNGSSRILDQRSDQNKVSVVYFDLVKVPKEYGGPRIKIGESGNHKKRLEDHSKSKFGIPFNVEHLCVVRGTRADEQQVLQYFEKYKLENEKETFWPNDELVDYIRWLRDQYFVWVQDDPQCQPVYELCAVDATLWMPNSERIKKGPQNKLLFSRFGDLNLPPREVTIDDLYTNELIIKAVRLTLVDIDLDPASHPVANRVVCAKRFYSLHDDGLSKTWSGRVWLNPPFSQWQAWVPKLVNEWRSGRVSAMCVLCATRTLTAQYYADVHETCTAMCVLRGRHLFWGGRAGPSPDDGHVIFYFGNEPESFKRGFGALGQVYVNGSWTSPGQLSVEKHHDPPDPAGDPALPAEA